MIYNNDNNGYQTIRFIKDIRYVIFKTHEGKEEDWENEEEKEDEDHGTEHREEEKKEQEAD